MTEPHGTAQLADWIVSLMSQDSEPSPLRDYYLILLRQGRGVPEALGMAVDDLLEEVRSAVSREESYNPRAHRQRLGLPSFVTFSPHRLPRAALVRRIVQERVGDSRGHQGRQSPRRVVERKPVSSNKDQRRNGE